MRTRYRTIVHKSKSAAPRSASVMKFPCGQPSAIVNTNTYAGYGDMPTHYTDEWISDGLGKNSAHAVVHRSKVVKIDETEQLLNVPNADSPGGYVQWYGYEPAWTPSNAYWMSNGLAWGYLAGTPSLPFRWTIDVPSPSLEASMKEGVMEKANQLRADVLLDVVEANQMWPAIKSLCQALPKLEKNWRSIRRFVKVASGDYLAWKFGVNPVLQDIMAINRHLGHLKSDFKRHVDQQAMTVSRLAQCVARFNDTVDVRNTYFSYHADTVYWRGSVFGSPTVRYVLTVKPKIKYETPLFQQLDYALSRFATSPAQLAWELVPFSFVVDWLVDVRGALRLVDKAVGHSPYEIISFTRSFNYELRTEVDHEYLETCGGALLNSSYCGSYQYKHYERYPVATSGSLLTWQPRFGKNQAGISAALILQRLKR